MPSTRSHFRTLAAAGAAAFLLSCGGSDGPAGPEDPGVTASSDLITVGTLVLSRNDPTSLETLEVEGTVRNAGTGGTGGGFRVALLANGVEVASANVGALSADQSQSVSFSATNLLPGSTALQMLVDADGQVQETNEGNNSVQRTITVLAQNLASVDAEVTGLSGSLDAELLFRVDLGPDVDPPLTIELSGGTGDVDLFVEGGDRPASREDYDDCQSGSPTTAERCQITNLTESTYHILLHAFSPFSGVTMSITLGEVVLPYDIEIVFIDSGTAGQNAAVQQAADRWMSIITTDVSDSDFSSSPVAPGDCVTGQPEVNDNVDDVRIFVSIVEIDGVSGTLAQAGPCVRRGLTSLPILGSMKFDEADLDQLEQNGGLLSVVLHEMGHVLGIGTIWDARGFLQNPSLPSNQGADTHFNGPLAIQAFDAAGGASYAGGQKVPVENQLGEGSGDSHWRENVLRLELMTPQFTSGQLNPLSAISIQSMADLGYEVDVTQADAYTGSFNTASLSRASAVPGPSPVIDLSGDVREGPVVVVDYKGRIVEVRR